MALVLSLLAIMGMTCALGLDFDALSNTCDLPHFDVPTYNTYCGGTARAMEAFSPVDVGFRVESEQNTYVTAADIEDTFVAFATRSGYHDTMDPDGCHRITVGVSLGQWHRTQGITRLAEFSGTDLGIRLATTQTGEIADCSDPAGRHIWPTDIDIIETSPRIRLVASFLEGGMLYLEFEKNVQEGNGSDWTLARALHVSGLQEGPTEWTCDLGACVLSEGQPCDHHTLCARGHYCHEGQCTLLPGEFCFNDTECPDELACNTRLVTGRCQIPCTTDGDCTHPDTCNLETGFCGGRTFCELVDSCSASEVCLDHQCYPACDTTAVNWQQQPSSELGCFDVSTATGTAGDGIWGSLGALGRCVTDTQCRFHGPRAIEVIGPRYFFDNQTGVVLLTYQNPARLGTLDSQGHFDFSAVSLEPNQFLPTSQDDAYFTDALYDADQHRLYLAITNAGIVTIDLSKLEAAELTVSRLGSQPWSTDWFDFHAFSGETAGWITRIALANGMLAVLEVDSYEELVPTGRGIRAARAIILQPNATTGFTPIASYELGDSHAPDVAFRAVDPNLVLLGWDSTAGARLLLHDLSSDTNPLNEVDLGELTPLDQRTWTYISDDIVFLSTQQSVFPIAIDIEGERL